MHADGFVRDWQKATVGAIRTLDGGLLTDVTNPFVRTGRAVTGFPGAAALEPPRIDILPSAEKRAKKRDLVCG
jgi:hypothetical protein